MLDPRDAPPDRKDQYKNADPRILLEQLNENWRQLRLLRTALSDRDEAISILHAAIAKRDQLYSLQAQRIRLLNKLQPLAYSAVGGAISVAVQWAIKTLARVR